MRMIRIIIAGLVMAATVGAALPQKVFGIDFRPLDTLVGKAVRDSVFPGASMVVLHKGRMVYHKAFGKMTYDRGSLPVDTTTVYDLASLTKAIATTSVTMQLWERDSLDLDAPVSRYLPQFSQNGKAAVTVRNLLLHNSGLRAHALFYKTCRTPDEVIDAICADSLLAAPGKVTTYSDLGFIVLGRIIEKITGKSLAENFYRRFSAPLGMTSTMFNPSSRLLSRTAPVEADTSWHFDRLRPRVHDQNAALLDGVAGHAGLFSTTGDLAKFMSMMTRQETSGDTFFLKPSTVRMFTSRTGRNARALGWDLRAQSGPSTAGDYFSPEAWGHLGFTGTSIWVDPKQELAVIFLSNRVYPSSENIRIRAFRPILHDTVAECLGLNKPAP
jgi:CubicO group peptidase (beta-lactamase class C family)